MDALLIAEIFYSLQGEGYYAGIPAVFIRFAGCNLRCGWCDTGFAQEMSAGTQHSVGQILEQIRDYPARHVVITGGEPTLQEAGLVHLCATLKERGSFVTIETNALLKSAAACGLWSFSPKIEALKEHWPIIKQNILAVPDDFQIKWVIGRPGQITAINTCTAELRLKLPHERVFLMPQGGSRAQQLKNAPWVWALCCQYGYRMAPRLQTLVWNKKRGI